MEEVRDLATHENQQKTDNHYISDEVSALVLDIGSSTTRAGYAGEDTPRTVFSTTYGYIPKEGAQDPITGVSSTDAQLFLGDKISTWRPGMQANNPMRDGISAYMLVPLS